LEVYGSGGLVTLDFHPIVSLFGARFQPIDHEVTPDNIQGGALERQVDSFCTSLRTGTPPTVVTLSEATHGVRVAEAIIESSDHGGRQVNLTS
jgi:predicted dehydrogenase